MPFAGQRIKALDFTPAVGAESTVPHLNIGTTPVVGSPEVGVVFTAPTSGKALVTIGASIGDDSGANTIGIIDYQLYLGTNASGTLVLGTGSLNRRCNIAAGDTAGQTQEMSRTSLVTGLTPGASYYVRTMHYSYTGTPDLFARQLAVQPLPA